MIRIAIPSLPPSVNKAYTARRGNHGRVLTAEGRAYKLETQTYIARRYPTELTFFRPDATYALAVTFTFKDRGALYTLGEKAKSKFKRLDVSNRLKLFEDALAAATGIDDSQNFLICIRKNLGTSDSTTLLAWDIEKEPSPLHGVLEQFGRSSH